MGEQSKPGNFPPPNRTHFSKYTHFSHPLEVVHSMLTVAVFLIMRSADHSSIPNNAQCLPHGKKS